MEEQVSLAVYPPPRPGMPYLAVMVVKGGEVVAVAFDSADEAQSHVDEVLRDA